MTGIWAGCKGRLDWLSGQAARLSRFKRWCVILTLGLVLAAGVALSLTWDDIMKTEIDPKEPFQTYVRRMPKAPDYSRASAWALNPVGQVARRATGPVDVFFVHPTTFNGGRDWNGPIDDKASARQLERVMLPNYAGPFARVGRVFAPRYRQASLYAYRITLREDALDARRFAYGDVLDAFRYYMAHYNFGRPYIVVGVEQGADLADRLLREEIDHNPGLTGKLAAAYLIDAVIPAAGYGPGAPIPACRMRAQAHCVVAWASADKQNPASAGRLLSRAMVWTPGWMLDNLPDGEPVLCVNPLTGGTGQEEAPARLNLGAVNASELEWGARAAFLPRQVSAQCVDGILRVSRPRSGSLQPASGWPDKFKERPYNPFFADLEADAMKRVATYYGRAEMPPGAPPIERSVPVDVAPVHKVD
ncbi:MAG TPA: DUF3089 domain-containing protein [Caulobacteraceae bacterium]